jgi:hypothetical protein
MVNNFTNISKINNYLKSLNTKIDLNIIMQMEIQVLVLGKHNNVAGINLVNGIPILPLLIVGPLPAIQK